MMDWSSVLELSRQALSIDGTIKSKYQCFVNRFNSVGGKNPQLNAKWTPEYQFFKNNYKSDVQYQQQRHLHQQ